MKILKLVNVTFFSITFIGRSDFTKSSSSLKQLIKQERECQMGRNFWSQRDFAKSIIDLYATCYFMNGSTYYWF